ncbi:hypothetical protein [Clostridium lundense]|uniref:hypothetical protein n=1 Tax=Clostridium lundense TaxID=319475 RepID=UPI0004833889|nr:hypothetical protein [Clostridium lundense]
MLISLLCEIAKGEDYSDRSLAKKLNTSEEVIKSLKRELQLRKYLKIEDENECCCEKCTGCASCSSNKLNNIKIWSLTEKGKKLLT